MLVWTKLLICELLIVISALNPGTDSVPGAAFVVDGQPAGREAYWPVSCPFSLICVPILQLVSVLAWTNLLLLLRALNCYQWLLVTVLEPQFQVIGRHSISSTPDGKLIHYCLFQDLKLLEVLSAWIPSTASGGQAFCSQPVRPSLWCTGCCSCNASQSSASNIMVSMRS